MSASHRLTTPHARLSPQAWHEKAELGFKKAVSLGYEGSRQHAIDPSEDGPVRVVKLVMLEFIEKSVEPTIGGLLAKMDRELYLIPGMAHAVASILNHHVPKIVARRVYESQTSMRAVCEDWSKEANPTKAMSGFAQTTHILNQMLEEEEVEIDNAVDPDYVPKRAGFVKESNAIEVVVPTSGAIAAAEARYCAAEVTFNNVSEPRQRITADRSRPNTRDPRLDSPRTTHPPPITHYAPPTFLLVLGW